MPILISNPSTASVIPWVSRSAPFRGQPRRDGLRQRRVDLRRAQLREDAAVHVKDLPGDVARVIRREERDHARDLVRVATAREERHDGAAARALLGALLRELLRHDRAGPDGVHADTEWSEV